MNSTRSSEIEGVPLSGPKAKEIPSYPSQWRMFLRTFTRHPHRVAGRFLWFIGELVRASVSYLMHVTARPQARGPWLRHSCQRFLRVFNVSFQISGPVPSQGLLVSNHLSYLDITLLGALSNSIFVAKHEVRRWPVLGQLAWLAGTIFVRREKPSDAVRAGNEMQAALNTGSLVVLFPEGTSSGGDKVLSFKSALLAPIVQANCPVTAACIHYSLPDGSVCDEVCYWRDMTLLPHLLNLLGKRKIFAQVSFAVIPRQSDNRKELARRLHAEVVRLQYSTNHPN